MNLVAARRGAYNGAMKGRIATRLFLFILATVLACATQGGHAKSGKKGSGCDNFAHPCPADQTCIDGGCRPRACATDSDCSGSGSCLEGWCLQRQCKANSSCLGEDETAGTADDRSCIGAVCLPLACPRDGKRCPPRGKESCAWSSDCGAGRICYDATCTSVQCTADKDCLPRVCYAGVCLDPDCDDRKPCAAGRNCVNGLCLVTAATSDGAN